MDNGQVSGMQQTNYKIIWNIQLWQKTRAQWRREATCKNDVHAKDAWGNLNIKLIILPKIFMKKKQIYILRHKNPKLLQIKGNSRNMLTKCNAI